jgi:hypothetical protein
MGHWFGKFDSNKSWRKTPAKIKGNWYTPTGQKVKDPGAYFKAIKKNGRNWEGDTGWND